MTPFQLVSQHYQLPVQYYPFQITAVDELGPLPEAGLYLDVGCGKTLTSIAAALYKLFTKQVHRVICIMPPILITNWSRNLSKIQGVSHTCYRGSPAQRKELNLNVDFLLVSYDIFKRDWAYLHDAYFNSTVLLICDEAQAVKNVGTATHKKVRDFAVCNQLMLLTGTPLSNPLDAYAYIKMVAPTIYRNQLQFEQIHVAKYDFFDKPVAWSNIDLLADNLKVNSQRVLKEDVLKDLPPVTYTELLYDLSPKHAKLYNDIAETQLQAFDDGTKIDLTSASALFNAMQQLPCNAEHFSNGEIESSVLEMIDEIMTELGGGKLVIFTKYIMTNRRLLEKFNKYGVRAVYGEVSPKQKQLNLDAFINDKSCKMILLQLQSAGAGLDGLQDVCSDVLFVELPPTAASFTQAVARVHRSGQHKNVNVRIAIALKTIQAYLWESVQDKDYLVNRCIRGPQDLRDAVMGNVRRMKLAA